ncbi:hypothetical protein KFE98_21455 [bacterium SCSIO 12741]|nr:hypothetical protein KFE98_21455 [bacterium SCSIO 12741]
MAMMRYLLLAALLVFLGCKKDPDFGPQQDNPEIRDSLLAPVYSALVLNEGNFTYNNASLTLVDLDQRSDQQDFFFRSNQVKLGDVAQSITVRDTMAWIVVNYSGLIYQVSLPEVKIVKTLNGFVSPRYLLPVSDTIAWVSDLGAEKIYQLNLRTGEVSTRTVIEGWIEEMIVVGDRVFACMVKSHEVIVLNKHSGQVEKRISVGNQPQSLVQDYQGKVWVLCDGGWNVNTRKNPRLDRIDVDRLQVDFTYTFPNIEDSPTRLRTDGAAQQLYFLNRGIYRIDVTNNTPSPELWLETPGRNLYGLGVSPDGKTILATDAGSFTAKGSILHIDSSANLLKTYPAGFIPQHVAFYRSN